jgi:hypothetical protein
MRLWSVILAVCCVRCRTSNPIGSHAFVRLVSVFVSCELDVNIHACMWWVGVNTTFFQDRVNTTISLPYRASDFFNGWEQACVCLFHSPACNTFIVTLKASQTLFLFRHLNDLSLVGFVMLCLAATCWAVGERSAFQSGGILLQS